MSPHPLHPDAPTEDWIPLVGAAMAFAACLGTGLMALVLLLVRRLVTAGPATATPDAFAAPGVALLLGSLAACAAAFAAAWFGLRPIGNVYRQAALASVAGLVTLLAGFLSTPVYHALGPAGLVGIALLAAVGAALARRSLRRHAVPSAHG
jgi:hypothetical protein